MEQKSPSETQQTAVLYFTEQPGELLFYEETFVQGESAFHSDGSFWNKTKARFDKFSFEAFAGDRFIRRLRRIRNIKILLGTPIDPQVVRTKLKAMLRDRKYHHLRWLVVDSLLLPLSLLIAPLPGPNLVGYYLLLRAYMHWKAFRSASKANIENVDVEVSSRAEELNALLQKAKDVRSALQELRARYGLRALQESEFIPQSESIKNTWRRLRSN